MYIPTGYDWMFWRVFRPSVSCFLSALRAAVDQYGLTASRRGRIGVADSHWCFSHFLLVGNQWAGTTFLAVMLSLSVSHTCTHTHSLQRQFIAPLFHTLAPRHNVYLTAQSWFCFYFLLCWVISWCRWWISHTMHCGWPQSPSFGVVLLA